MKNHQTLPTPKKGWLPLIIALLTIAIVIVSVISLLSGWQTIFQNLFYFPIILACVYYVKRGFVFSVLLACGYFILILTFSNDPVVLQGALIRVLIFFLFAGVITYLSVCRIRAEDTLKESEEFNRGLVENMPDLVVVYDHDRKIRYVNTATVTTLGYSVEEMVGTDIMTYVDPSQHAEITASSQEQVPSDEGKSLEIGLITRAGQHLTVISKSVPLHIRNRPAVLILFADITDRKRAEDALRQANKQLNLLSSITRHDILNQLTALKGYLELSHEEIDNPATLIEYISRGEKAANAIVHQITFTKDYQELGAAAPRWHNVHVNIEKAVAGLPMRDVRVDVDRTDIEIFADPLFAKVFYNLIDNALRYGGDTMKTIRVSSQESDQRLIVVCEDDGMGISAEDKKRLFTQGFGKNNGLGLFLTREILGITGITIIENGTPGKGARFEIGVPSGVWRMKGANE